MCGRRDDGYAIMRPGLKGAFEEGDGGEEEEDSEKGENGACGADRHVCPLYICGCSVINVREHDSAAMRARC